MKYHEDIPKGIQDIEWTRKCLWRTDERTPGLLPYSPPIFQSEYQEQNKQETRKFHENQVFQQMQQLKIQISGDN